MINKTLGTGGDYTDWAALFAALEGATLSDDWTVTQISNINFGSEIILAILDLNGKTLRITQSVVHNGDPTIGFRTIYTANNKDFSIGDFFNTSSIQNGTIDFDGLIFDFNGKSGSSGFFLVGGKIAANVTIKSRNLLINMTGTGGSAFFSGIDTQFNFQGYNCKAFSSNGAHILFNFGTTGQAYNAQIENCAQSAFDVVSANNPIGSGGLLIRNTYGSFGLDGSSDRITEDHNASPDSTAGGSGNLGSGNLQNKSAASNFISTSWSSPDFLKLKSDSVLAYSGTAPSLTGNTVGAAGNARPHSGYYSIGADEGNGTPAVNATASLTAKSLALVQGTPAGLTQVAPDLLSPADGAIFRLGEVEFFWSGSDDGTLTYDLQVDSDPAFGAPVVAVSTLATRYRVALPFGSSYYWRVRARSGSVYSGWAGPRSLGVPGFQPAAVADHDASGRGRLLAQFQENA